MTDRNVTQMAREIAEMPDAVDRLATHKARTNSQAAARELRERAPKALITIARGSSDHAATYLSYAAEVTLGLPVASIGPSIWSVYQAELQMDGLAALAISQSGTSQDNVKLFQSMQRKGGYGVALTNTMASPLALASSRVIDISAGPELAVAATKSFLNSVVAGLWLIADWAQDTSLTDALLRLPDAMHANGSDSAISEVKAALLEAHQAVIIARGAGLGLAHEFALKLIEICKIHASSYSSAEVLHGPRALLVDEFPVIALTSTAGRGLHQTLDELSAQGARIACLPARTKLGHPLVDPLLDVQPLYRLAEALSVIRGIDPDSPRHLTKETSTV